MKLTIYKVIAGRTNTGATHVQQQLHFRNYFTSFTIR